MISKEEIVTEIDVDTITTKFTMGTMEVARIIKIDDCYIGQAGYSDFGKDDLQWRVVESSHNPFVVAGRMAIHIWANTNFDKHWPTSKVYTENKRALTNEASQDVW